MFVGADREESALTKEITVESVGSVAEERSVKMADVGLSVDIKDRR